MPEIETPPEVQSDIEPVTPEDLAKLSEFEVQRLIHAQTLLDLEMQKISLLAAARKSEQDRQNFYNALLEQRGLPVGEVYSIDSVTGVVNKEES